ncbi:MAG: hypothetical protein KKF85_17065 [Gammaproteobacteria bacterium]|nr:hypothetical protein [Gammaproteobacteria bacterium]MBU3988148.1 hypothetical protein [Gammaproteobacteria bacterium]MBU4006360.1 hypothetical protein [Gammaproteobacteria bacterium]MBU4097967.1 hypothetical protein [Gammaproteobacteria bacterium]MBU4148673.1 hypothetical protein [Gammaproteobacteria bacterium]
MSYYEQDGLQRTGGVDGVGGGQFNTPGMGPIGEQQAAGVNHMDNIWSAQAKMDIMKNAGTYGSAPTSYVGGGRASPPMSASARRFLRGLLLLALIAGLAYGGWWAYSHPGLVKLQLYGEYPVARQWIDERNGKPLFQRNRGIFRPKTEAWYEVVADYTITEKLIKNPRIGLWGYEGTVTYRWRDQNIQLPIIVHVSEDSGRVYYAPTVAMPMFYYGLIAEKLTGMKGG